MSQIHIGNDNVGTQTHIFNSETSVFSSSVTFKQQSSLEEAAVMMVMMGVVIIYWCCYRW